MRKTLSIILILIMLILPFGMLLNVRAEGLVITVDNAVTKEGDSNSKLVTNEGTITVHDINNKISELEESETDTFKAYKILDTFYNENANEITYDFTSDFKRFKQSLDSNDTYKNITINEYMALTGDKNENDCYDYNENNECINWGSYYIDETPSTLNVLVSKYATFIRKNQDTANEVNGIELLYDSSSQDESVKNEHIKAGAYLILPSSTIENHGIKDGLYYNLSTLYGVMVGNVYISTENNEYVLNNADIHSKGIVTGLFTALTNYSTIEYIATQDKVDSGEVEWEEFEAEHKKDLNITIGHGFSGLFMGADTAIPVNTHKSISENSDIMDKINTITITLPTGLKFNFDNLPSEVTRRGNDIYYTEDEEEIKAATIVSDTVLKAYEYYIADIVVDQTHPLTAGAANNIVTTGYVLKEPYVDIGSNPTDEDIAKVLKEVTMTNSVYTYGLKVFNVDSKNSDKKLVGSMFQLCSDSTCNTLIGDAFTVQANGNDTYGELVGVSGDETIYLKQTKAPSGYSLIKEPIPVALENMNEENGYYLVEIPNNTMLSLPFTGGTGTIIYTSVGLLIIIGSATVMLLYKNKKSKVIEEL